MEAFIAAAACGVIIGLFSGLLGIGGGTVMVPVFRLGFGMSAIGATATSLFTIIPTSISGCITHIRNKTCIPKVGIITGIAGAVCSPLGVYLASISPAWAIMLAAALIIGYSAFTMIRKAMRMPKPSTSALSTKVTLRSWRKAFSSHGKEGEGATSGASYAAGENGVTASGAAASGAAAATLGAGVHAAGSAGAVASEEPDEGNIRMVSAADATNSKVNALPNLSLKKLAIAVPIGMVAGLASGYVGVGGGFIMVPLFLSVLGITMKHASGTSLIAVVILAIPAVVAQGFLGNIDYIAGIAMAIGSIPGAVLGASLVSILPERRMRFIFGGFLFVAAAVLMANEILPLFFV